MIRPLFCGERYCMVGHLMYKGIIWGRTVHFEDQKMSILCSLRDQNIYSATSMHLCPIVLNRVCKDSEIKIEEVPALFSQRTWMTAIPERTKLEPLVNTSSLAVTLPKLPPFAASIQQLTETILTDLAVGTVNTSREVTYVA